MRGTDPATFLLRLLIGVISGLALARGLIFLARHSYFPLTFHWLLLLPVWVPLGVAVHESAHLLAGRLVGVRFPQWQIGPLLVNRQYRPPRIQWLWRAWFGGGHVSARPTRMDRLAARMTCLIAAGPLASLLFAGALYWLALEAVRSGHETLAGVTIACWVVALCVFWIAIAPHRRVNLMSDGSLLWLLFHSRAERARWLTQVRLLTALDDGFRPALWSLNDVAALQLPAKSPGLEGSLFLAYLARMDRNDVDEADRILRAWVDAVRTHAAAYEYAVAEAVWFALMRQNDEARAREWRALLDGPSPGTHLRGAAAIALLDGIPNEIEAAFRNYRLEIEALSHYPLSAIDRELLQDMEARARHTQGASGSGTMEAQYFDARCAPIARRKEHERCTSFLPKMKW